MSCHAVLMPFKDAATYVCAAVESILAQSFEDFVLFAIDDGSSDGSRDLIEAYHDPRVRLVGSAGTGVSAALNTGLALCPDGALAARHDADDISHPDRFAVQLDYLRIHDATTVLATQAELIDASGVRTGMLATPCDYPAIRRMLRTRNPICHGSVMLRADRVIRAGGYDPAYPVAQGYQLWVRLARNHVLEALPGAWYQYRHYEQSWSHSNRPLRDELFRRISEQAVRTL